MLEILEIFKLLFESFLEFAKRLVGVVRTRTRDNRPLEGRNRLADIVDVRGRAEYLLKLKPVDFVGSQKRNHPLMGIAHLNRIGNRSDGLGLKVRCPPIPKLGLAQDPIERCRGIAAPGLPLDPHPKLRVRSISGRRTVAIGTTDRRVLR